MVPKGSKIGIESILESNKEEDEEEEVKHPLRSKSKQDLMRNMTNAPESDPNYLQARKMNQRSQTQNEDELMIPETLAKESLKKVHTIESL